jgi:RNA polymerase sigma factor (sigma-70 family)
VSQGSFTITVDELTIGRARRGDGAALETLFRAFETPVYNLARRMCRTPHDAEDVLQETFLEVVRSIRRFRGDGPLAGWIRKVAASKALMRLRRRARGAEDPLTDEVADGAGKGRDGRGSLAATPERLDLEAALDRLGDSARAVVWLHDVEGYSHDEIAQLMGKTASFSKSALARAHARLRGYLAGPEGGTSCI